MILAIIMMLVQNTLAVHPYVYISQAEINVINTKVNSNQAPWKNAYTKMLSNANSALNKSNQSVVDNGGGCTAGPHQFSIDGPYNNTTTREYKDVIAAHAIGKALSDLGLAYAFTKQSKTKSEDHRRCYPRRIRSRHSS